MPDKSVDQTKVVAHLPGFDLEIVHRPPHGDVGEAIGVMLRAVDTPLLPDPSFLAMGAFPAMNPLVFNPFLMWLEMSQAAWRTWLGAFALPGPKRN